MRGMVEADGATAIVRADAERKNARDAGVDVWFDQCNHVMYHHNKIKILVLTRRACEALLDGEHSVIGCSTVTSRSTAINFDRYPRV